MKHEKGVRVYGVTIGNSSAARITAGAVEGLGRLGQLAGLVPVDAFDEEEVYPGATAKYGVLLGPPNNVNMLLHGAHKRNFVMLAPNSNWVPQLMIQTVKDLDASLVERKSQVDFVAPSRWAAEQIQPHWHRKVTVWRHGAADGFGLPDRILQGLDLVQDPDVVKAYYNGYFKVLHLTSSAGERKGTAELIRAWQHFANKTVAMEMKKLKLTIVTEPGRHFEDLSMLVKQLCPDDRPRGCTCPMCTTIEVMMRLDYSVEEMAQLYHQHHIVCQPSRGEGFGLVPLEARMCGVPVVMTGCTGHSEHVDLLSTVTPKNKRPMGVIVVKTGSLERIDDGPGARAPSLRSPNIMAALLQALRHWDELHREAVDVSHYMRRDWSWVETTRRWIIDEVKHG